MSDQALYRYFNSGDALGAAGVIPADEKGEYTFLPSRSAGQCCPWILTADLHDTPDQAEQGPLARFLWGAHGSGLREGVLGEVASSRQPAAVLAPVKSPTDAGGTMPDTKAMLALLEKSLDAYPLEQTLERLHSYGDEGPSVDEFVAQMDESISRHQK